MAHESKREKIAKAITLLESMTRAQWLTGAITGSNTATITAIQLLNSAMQVQQQNQRKKKTPVQNEIELKQPKD